MSPPTFFFGLGTLVESVFIGGSRFILRGRSVYSVVDILLIWGLGAWNYRCVEKIKSFAPAGRPERFKRNV